MGTGVSISGYRIVQDEGITVPSRDTINFTGAGVTVTNVAGTAQVYIPAPPSGLTYKGLWNATLNSPTLVSSVGTIGDFYIVSVAGTTNLDGITDWQIGDWVIFEGGVWQKVDNHDIQAYNTVKDESTILPQRSVLKFTGSGVTASDISGETIVDIPGNIPSTSYGLYAQIALGTDITNTIVETSLIGSGVGTLSVPANAFNVGDSFTAKMCGNLSCANNETIHVRVKSNGITIADAGVFQMKLATNKYFELTIDFTIAQLGGPGTGTLNVNGQYAYNQNANTNLDGINFALISNTTFDTTIPNTLTITAQWGAANVNNSIQSQNFVLQKVY